MTSQQESKPFGADESRGGFEVGQASGSGSNSEEPRNGGPSNLKAMESKDAAQREGRNAKPRGPPKRGGHIQRGEHTQRDEYTQQGAGGTHAGPSRGRPANFGNREASGYKKQQQTRASNHDRAKDTWSVKKEPKVRPSSHCSSLDQHVYYYSFRVLRFGWMRRRRGCCKLGIASRGMCNSLFSGHLGLSIVWNTLGVHGQCWCRFAKINSDIHAVSPLSYGVSHSHSDLDMVIIVRSLLGAYLISLNAIIC